MGSMLPWLLVGGVVIVAGYLWYRGAMGRAEEAGGGFGILNAITNPSSLCVKITNGKLVDTRTNQPVSSAEYRRRSGMGHC